VCSRVQFLPLVADGFYPISFHQHDLWRFVPLLTFFCLFRTVEICPPGDLKKKFMRLRFGGVSWYFSPFSLLKKKNGFFLRAVFPFLWDGGKFSSCRGYFRDEFYRTGFAFFFPGFFFGVGSNQGGAEKGPLFFLLFCHSFVSLKSETSRLYLIASEDS